MEPADLDHLTAVWLCMKHELARMVRQGSGAIVNVSSVAGLRAAVSVKNLH